MRTWDVLFPDVLPLVLGCPEPTVERALLRAAREFCAKTRCWRADLDRITTRAATSAYDLSYPSQADAVEFVNATMDGQEIDIDVVDQTTAQDRQAGNHGSRRILTWDQRSIVVMPTPAAAGALIVITAILQPSESATGVPNDIGDRYREEIACGALARLLAMPKTEWTDKGTADRKEAEFKGHIGDVKKKVWKGYSNRRPRTIGQYF